MPWDLRVGHIEPDAVPGPILVDRGFQEGEPAPDPVPRRPGQRLGGGPPASGLPFFRCGRPQGRRRVVECPAKKLERCRTGPRRLSFGRAEPAPRRENHMRRGIRLLVHVNLMVLGQRHAELALDRLPGFPEETFAKVAVFLSS